MTHERKDPGAHGQCEAGAFESIAGGDGLKDTAETQNRQLLPSGVLAEIMRRSDGAFDVVFWTTEYCDAACVHYRPTLAAARALVAEAGGADERA